MAYYGKLPIVLLSELAAGKEDSYNCRIAAYLLRRLGENVSVDEIAGDCFVSRSAVSRFCRDVGLEDFQELKALLAQEGKHFERISAGLPAAEQTRSVAARAAEAMLRAEATLDREALERLAGEIACAPRVACFGLLKAETAALSLQSDLIMLGKAAGTKVSFREQMDYLKSAGEDDLVVVFSFRGIYFDYDIPFEARQTRAKVWLVSGSPQPAQPSGFRPRGVLSFRTDFSFAAHPYQLLVVAGILAQRVAERLAGEGG